ncbi:uncharacterized protein LOC119079351 [Bradysia coprophila]|uniref:uncharacterized protein LOC119079351 n=1 Tax=Bradysia coprophila TaxID=38358 RepID=UPI00187DCF32|nr:uncharacterized protein LOC119079351 [Bradysia coprophila]
MDERTIRSRRPIRPAQRGSYSPSHGSPIRRNENELYPHLSGGEEEDDVDQELIELESYADTNSSLNTTLNSSSDVADCGGIKVSRCRKEKNVKYYPDGNVQEVNMWKTSEKILLPKKADESQGMIKIVLVGIGVVVVMLAAVYFYLTNHSQIGGDMKRPPLRCSFEQSVRDFPKQDKMLWKSLEHGVESVLNNIPTKPSIFLLAYEDIPTANKITRSIVERATDCMDSKVNALVLSSDDLAHHEMKTDYGVVITKFKNQLEKSGVMLVHDLNKVPSKVAPAFHVFCDGLNPLVDRSIIFLTMQLTDNSHSSSYANTLHLVENYLRSNWSDMENFILDPLIARVTDQVFVLNKE